MYCKTLLYFMSTQCWILMKHVVKLCSKYENEYPELGNMGFVDLVF